MKAAGLIALVFVLMAGAGFAGNIAGVREGYDQGYLVGAEDVADDLQQAYDNGYDDGLRDGQEDAFHAGFLDGQYAGVLRISEDMSRLAERWPDPFDFAVEVFSYMIDALQTADDARR